MIEKKEILKKYVCSHPFTYLDVQENGDYLCCPSWCKSDISKGTDRLSWNSEQAKRIRASILDGSYSYCDHEVCPSLNSLINKGEPSNCMIDKRVAFFLTSYEHAPEEIVFGWDRSCNLSCPSCRSHTIKNDAIDSTQYIKKRGIIDAIETKFGRNVKRIVLSGSGDPFYSNVFREYLMNFNKDLYPSLQHIQIVTNGNMMTPDLWRKMKASPYIKVIEISIDSANEDNYESEMRPGASWKKLIDNLEFLSTIKTVKSVIVSMVISEKNFMEMKEFYDKMTEIFQFSTFGYTINYRQHVFWGTGKYTESEVNAMQVFNLGHPRHSEFMTQLGLIHGLPHVNHNFNHLI
jgi:organic radical activating enzyme